MNVSYAYIYVEFDNTESEMLPVTIGVPQGSILGLLLFICNKLYLFNEDWINSHRLI